METTLAIIKPDAVHRSEEIEDIILRSGFTILQKRRIHLTPEQASYFYAEHSIKLFFPSLVAYMSSGPIISLGLSKEKAINTWRELIGPTNTLEARQTHPDCLRAIYGTDDQRNALHGSDNHGSADREIRFFFSEDSPLHDDRAALKCGMCGNVIAGCDRRVEAMDQNYHYQCFSCSVCDTPLAGSAFFKVGDLRCCEAHKSGH